MNVTEDPLARPGVVGEIYAAKEDVFTTSLLPLENNTSNASATNMYQRTPHCKLFEFILYTVAMGSLCILGFVGNTLSFLVLNKDRSSPVASFLLQSLAIVDNLFLLLWTIHYSVRYMLNYLEIQTSLHSAWLYVRVYAFPLLYMAQMETIWLTVVIALNRYMAVCMPYKAPHLCSIYNVYKEVVAVTIFAIVSNIPRFFELKITHKEDMNGEMTTKWVRTSLYENESYKLIYTDAFYYLFTFVLPLLILAWVNTRVTIAYHAAKKRKRRMTSRRVENENNITLVMIIVVLIFMMCQAPARIVQLIWSYQYNHCSQIQYYLIHVSNTLEVLNSSINFLIYFLFRKRFRNIIWDSFCVGPLVSLHRLDSNRLTTTEGLSLAHFEPTNLESLANQGEFHDNRDVELDTIRQPEHTQVPVNGDCKAENNNGEEEEVMPQEGIDVPLSP